MNITDSDRVITPKDRRETVLVQVAAMADALHHWLADVPNSSEDAALLEQVGAALIVFGDRWRAATEALVYDWHLTR